MKPERAWTLLYLTLVGAIFVVVYLALRVRELGLALVLLGLNLPASVLTVPAMERACGAAGMPAGSPAHVWLTQATAMACNGTLVFVTRRLLGRRLDR